jgi:endonuclease-3 related protein
LKRLSKEEFIRGCYRTLSREWGAQHWWPARTRFEVIVGAYLTQNTSWTNVEKALVSLRANRLLTLNGIRNLPLRQLETAIRSAGYFRQKARRLKTFVAYLDARYGGSLNRMFTQPTEKLRHELLELNGVGPETADSILLYAGQHPVFVIDTYTRRVLDRHKILPANSSYDEIRELSERALSDMVRDPILVSQGQDSFARQRSEQKTGAPGASHPPSLMSLAQRSPLTQTYNEMHGLIVGVGKNYCLKANPNCEACPLRVFLPKK